jgi:hypothetical protein
MAGRIRSIKPEILEDEKTAGLCHVEWRLFVSLWLISDDYGNLRGDPDYVRGQCLWATRETRETVANALEGLASVSLVSRYAVRGQSYLHIAGWDKHQKVDKPGKARMPGPEQADGESLQAGTLHSRDSRETLEESSRDSRDTLAPDLRPPTSDHDRKRPEKSAPSAAARPRSVKTLLPDDWTAGPELAAVAREQGVDLGAEMAKMRDWAQANAIRKADWIATARGWLRRARDARPGLFPARPPEPPRSYRKL